tara:strand:- start:220 stop:504 length:285 start_codon:yes stop_codon:yes gene_type:complete
VPFDPLGYPVPLGIGSVRTLSSINVTQFFGIELVRSCRWGGYGIPGGNRFDGFEMTLDQAFVVSISSTDSTSGCLALRGVFQWPYNFQFTLPFI